MSSSILYKYLNPEASSRFLRQRAFTASNPLSFNDQFEVRPHFDQERHRHYLETLEHFHGSSPSVGPPLKDIPTHNVIGLSDRLHERCREEIGAYFRVLCLCRNFQGPAMWGNYADSFRGIVVGIDTAYAGFPQGIQKGGAPITYTADRSKTRLPLAYYRFPWIDSIVRNQNQEIKSDGGLFIPFWMYRQKVEAAFVSCLTTKAPCWRYEREVRFIYDLREHAAQLSRSKGFHVVRLPPKAIREVIIGFRADPRLVAKFASSAKSGFLHEAKLFYTWCHPNRYRVLREETSHEELHWRFDGSA